MLLGIETAGDRWAVGTPDTLHAFFSTVAVRLESGRWGARFPRLMTSLYLGAIEIDHVDEAITEVRDVRLELATWSAADLVWDADDTGAPAAPDGGLDLDASNLADCFQTPDGRPLLEVMTAGLFRLRLAGAGGLRIVELDDVPVAATN